MNKLRDSGSKAIILDTSAFIARNFNLKDPDAVIPISVIEEIQKGKLKREIGYAEEMLNLRVPDNSYRNAVVEFAQRTGDINVLSETDIDVISLGMELNGIVMTDDFAIQNVCRAMGIEFIPASNLSIRKTIMWTYRCTGCRKYFSTYREKCDICGHEVRRTSSRNKPKNKI
jgi:UPF0271 protein